MSKWVQWTRSLWSEYVSDGGGLLSAAVAYFTLFALAPMLMLVVLAGQALLGQAEFADRVFTSLATALGAQMAVQVQRIVDAYLASRSSRVGAGVVGVLLLMWAAGGLFAKLQQAFNMLWHVRVRADLTLATKLRLLGARLLFALLPIALAAISLFTAAASGWLAGLLGGRPDLASRLAESPVTVAVIAWLGVLVLYRLLPFAEVQLADALWPSLVVAAAWTLGTLLFGLYLARGTTSAAGAAGSVFALLVWLNFSAQALLLGCTACRLVAEHHGRGGPSEYAELSVPEVSRQPASRATPDRR